MSYREPERHLDDAVRRLLASESLSPTSRFGGLTYKDGTTLERLRRLGCADVRTLDTREDLGITDSAAGLETIQDRLSDQLMTTLKLRGHEYDCLIVRHILEHAHDTAGFITALSRLVVPGGYLLVEVPDCAESLSRCDYTMLWEEHVAYFTQATLERALERCGFLVQQTIVYPYTQENSLVTFARFVGQAPGNSGSSSLPDDVACNYAGCFENICSQWRSKLSDLRKSHGPIALFGAGHRTTTFLKLLGIETQIDFVVDEAADKIGLYLPGTSLQIAAPSALTDQPVGACLLAVSAELEDDVVRRFCQIRERGGEFFSIFPGSKYAIRDLVRLSD